MAKIAVELETADAPAAPPSVRLLAEGDGWTVSDIVCSSGPRDRPFEEQHSCTTIAIVVAGTFQYRSRTGREMMTPGSLLLGNDGNCFECGHEHGTGDRCVSFSYTPEFFDRISTEAAAGRTPTGRVAAPFKAQRLPPVRTLSPLIARASAALAGSDVTPWEELALRIAARALQLDSGRPPAPANAEPAAESRVTRVVRMIDACPDGTHDLASLAREARLSPFHFLRTFEKLTGLTPHQYLLRLRLREAAVRLSTGAARILDIALDSGFGDISNFNRTFRAEFGVTPRIYRAQTRP